jgi:hypothetical protein
MRDFITRAHTAITTSAGNVAASQKLYQENEDKQGDHFRGMGPR